MSEGDLYIYDDVSMHEQIEKPFTAKEMQVIYDSNNGVYNNQILFSTGQLANTGKYVDYQNAYIEVPVTMALSASAAIAGANPFMMGLKDGSIQLIDSIILQYNGTNMVQQSIFTNVIQHFKILSSWTQDDLTKWGDATLTYPDTTTGFRYTDNTAGSGTASPYGDGTSNNVVSPVTPAAITGTGTTSTWKTGGLQGSNSGFLRRMQATAYSPAGTVGQTQATGPLTPISSTNVPQIAKNSFTNPSGNLYVWQLLLTIRLKDMSDFFNKLPIMKASRIDLTINFNSFAGTVSYVGATGAAGPTASATLLTASYTQLAGHTCPAIVASGATALEGVPTQPNALLLAPAGSAGTATLTVGLGINGINASAFSGLKSSIFQNCRMYVPLYEMNPEYEQQLLMTNPMKTIYYDDFYTYTSITNVASGTNFQNLITSGVVNPKYLVLYPFYSGIAAGNNGTALGLAPYQSLFDSAPGTPSPAAISNFQVYVGGKTLFPLVELYNFQQFQDEFSSIFAINGGKSPHVTSGLISRTTWENAPIYVADISRRLPQDDKTPYSIQVSGTNMSAYSIDVIAFVIYERQATFNMINGLLTTKPSS